MQKDDSSARKADAHTPGKWQIAYDGCICNEHGDFVCAFRWDSFKEFNDSPRNKADARLIAAAPDLLTELREAVEVIHSWHGPEAWEIYAEHSPEMKRINAAIARATAAAASSTKGAA